MSHLLVVEQRRDSGCAGRSAPGWDAVGGSRRRLPDEDPHCPAGGRPARAKRDWSPEPLSIFLQNVALQIDSNIRSHSAPSPEKLDAYVAELATKIRRKIRHAPRRVKHVLQGIVTLRLQKFWNFPLSERVRSTAPEELRTAVLNLIEALAIQAEVIAEMVAAALNSKEHHERNVSRESLESMEFVTEHNLQALEEASPWDCRCTSTQEELELRQGQLRTMLLEEEQQGRLMAAMEREVEELKLRQEQRRRHQEKLREQIAQMKASEPCDAVAEEWVVLDKDADGRGPARGGARDQDQDLEEDLDVEELVLVQDEDEASRQASEARRLMDAAISQRKEDDLDDAALVEREEDEPDSVDAASREQDPGNAGSTDEWVVLTAESDEAVGADAH